MSECIFVETWDCSIDEDEFPLEICKTCVESKEVARNSFTVKPKSLTEKRKGKKSKQQKFEKKISENVSFSLDPDRLEDGSVYLVKGKDKKSAFRVFDKIHSNNLNTLCITRKHPSEIEETYGITDTDFVWLSTSNDTSAIGPKELDLLSLKIENFLSEEGDILFMSGLGYLFSNNPKYTMIHLLQSIEDQITKSGTTLILSTPSSSIEKEYVDILERELEVKDISTAIKPEKRVKPVKESRDELQKRYRGKEEKTSSENKERDKAREKLNKQFHEGNISVDEFIQKRKKIQR